MNGDVLALAISGLVQVLGPLMTEARKVLPAADYERLKAEQDAALAEAGAEEAAWVPADPPAGG